MLADAAYGTGAEFRQGLSARGLTWAVGILPTPQVPPLTVRLRPPHRSPGGGRPPTHPVPSAARRPAHGARMARAQHLPGEAAWLVYARRVTGEQKYYLTNHPASASLRQLATALQHLRRGGKRRRLPPVPGPPPAPSLPAVRRQVLAGVVAVLHCPQCRTRFAYYRRE